MRTIVYVDGFNLYYRLLKDRPSLKWLNPLLLVRRALDQNNIVTEVKYFTARVSGRLDPRAPARQKLYLNALATVPEISVHHGSFLVKKTWAGLVPPDLHPHKPNAKPSFQPWPEVVRIFKTEEKGSDVNLASHLLLDGFQDLYDVAAVVSNDTDLIEPMGMVRDVLKKPVGLLAPVDNPSPKLRVVSSFVRNLQHSDAAAAQFPNPVVDAKGTLIHKPTDWV